MPPAMTETSSSGAPTPIDKLLSSARETLLFMPDSTADNATRALWAEAFFGIAVWITHVELPFAANHD